MSITSYLSELESIKRELQRLKLQTKKLNERKSNLEEYVQDWFIKNNQTSVRYNNKIISIDNTTVRKRKKKQEKMNDFENILKNNGIFNTKQIINQLLDANKGNQISSTKLNFDQKK